MKRNAFGNVILMAGIVLFMAPSVFTFAGKIQSRLEIRAFDAANSDMSEAETGEVAGEESVEETVGYPIILGTEALLEQLQDYNQMLCEDGQDKISDAWAVSQAPSDIDCLADGVFGYITIPAMSVELPLYVGASARNLSRGAAILGTTSFPIGGVSTNCVIAGHRGYRGIPYFREIEELSVGDMVYVTNPWETLTYSVESIDIIDPHASEAIRIQEGKDMVTLLTCHPYRSGGKYRYVVYCVRNESGDTVSSADTDSDAITASDGVEIESSKGDIAMEKAFRALCVAILISLLAVHIVKNRKTTSKKR